MKEKKNDSLEVFESAPIGQAVMKNTIPAMVAMLMVLIYNLADTFFIGQTKDALMVAAVSLVTPAFLLFMALGTVFGIGGTSVISRAMGEGRREYAKKVCAFCMWGCVAVGIVMVIIIFVFMDPILKLLGASDNTIGYAREYLSIVTVAGIGVAMKVTMITGMICIGFGQGIQPLLGYCVGAKNWKRYKESLRFSVIFGLGLSTFMTVICYVFDRQIVSAFLAEPEALSYGVKFSRILLTTSFLFGMFYVLSNALQAMGAATAAFIINISRQGLIYIPAIFILQAVVGMDGLLWAQPVADVLSVILVIILYEISAWHHK